jgi:hypothetical protein
MTFDLLAYAAAHRLRARNLHAGGPVPPARAPRGTVRRPAYHSRADRDDAIICRDGYVVDSSRPELIEVCVLCRSGRGLQRCRGALAHIVTFVQVGDAEAAGHAPVGALERVLTALRPYRRREGPAGAGFRRPESTQAGVGVVEVG